MNTKCWCGIVHTEKSFGWTVIAKGGDPKKIHVYKRDVPADAAHFAADLAPFTHPSEAKARAAGARGEYAYKR